jgi:hypothetical protein
VPGEGYPGSFYPGDELFGVGEAAKPGPALLELAPASSSSKATLTLRTRTRLPLAPSSSSSAGSLSVFIPGFGSGKVHPPTQLNVDERVDTHMNIVVPDRTLMTVASKKTRLSVKPNTTRLVVTNYG